jgi:hypothetical protein
MLQNKIDDIREDILITNVEVYSEIENVMGFSDKKEIFTDLFLSEEK